MRSDGGLQIGFAELAGPHQDPFHSRRLCSLDITDNIVSYHICVFSPHIQAFERHIKETLFRFTEYDCLTPGCMLQCLEEWGDIPGIPGYSGDSLLN